MRRTHSTSATALSSEAWQRLEGILERFEDAWRRGERPALEDYLTAGAERRSLLIELACEDLEYRLQAGESARVEEYLLRFPELADDSEAALVLISAEYSGRQRWQPGCERAEYLRRFPEHRQALPDRLRQAAEDGRSAEGLHALTVPQSPVPAHSSPASRRVGPYVLNVLLGSGSFGEVWLATREGELAHTQLAVKLPHAARVDLAAIRHEAGLWAQIGSHPNIVPIFEASVYEGQVVIVSEYVAEGSLAEWLKRHGGKVPTPDEVARITLGVLAGLEHLHGLGIVHRDIKPANVLLQNGVPRLADFGLSRTLHAENLGSGRPAGTPAYMAPEAFDGVRSFQTDVWSVGVLFYLLLTGSLPFPGREWSALLKSILTRDLAPLPPDMAVVYGDILRDSLAKDPVRRYRSAAQMAARLRCVEGTAGVPSHSVRLLGHIASLVDSLRVALFINATNLSENVDREVTHVWIETSPKIHIENPRRPLPKRLRPQETWETWIELRQLPEDILNEKLPTLVRARLSTGAVLCGVENASVPESGWIPGEPVVKNANTGIMATYHPPAPKKQPWWKIW